MKIGIAQLNSNDNIADNLQQIKKMIVESQSEKPDILFFPENSLYFRIDSNSTVQTISLQDEVVSELKKICQSAQIAIHFTTALSEAGKVYNASVLIDKAGVAQVVYKKIHLFDIELSGQKPIRESDSFTHGSNSSVSEFQNFKIGNSICYDVRFAELYSQYAEQEVDLIVVPAAFLVKTGLAHWEVLLRARAIESQCFVVASAQAGTHRSTISAITRETFGHSMLVSPWGEIKAFKKDGVGVFFAELNQEEIKNVRAQIPMRNHRRIDF